MVSMIPHESAIVRDAPKVPEFNEFPKWMAHPAFQEADVGTEVRSPSGYSHHVGGTPIRFPPVLVHNADDEEYYAAKGYVSQGKSDAAAFQRLAAALKPVNANYKPIEFPKWAGGVLCNNAEEEAKALADRRDQLGIKPAAIPEEPAPYVRPAYLTAQPMPTDPDKPEAARAEPVVGKNPDQLRLDAIEAQVGDIKAMMADLLVRIAAPIPNLAAAVAKVMAPVAEKISPQQKAANSRKRMAAERAAAAAVVVVEQQDEAA